MMLMLQLYKMYSLDNLLINPPYFMTKMIIINDVNKSINHRTRIIQYYIIKCTTRTALMRFITMQTHIKLLTK